MSNTTILVSQAGTPAMVRATTGSVTGSWGTGQTRTAGDLLVAAVTAGGSTASAAALSTPSGWTLAGVVSNTATTANTWVAFYTKTAAGTDTAPTFTATLSGTVAMTCTLFEFAGAGNSSPVATTGTYASGGSAGTLSAMAVTTTGIVTSAGEYALTCFCQEAAAATNTWNPGSGWANSVSDGATSSVLHTAVDTQANPASGVALSETGHWTTDTTAFGAAMTLVIAPQTVATELFTNEGTTTITTGGTGAPASGTPEYWTAASWSSFPVASNTASPPTQFHIADPAQPTELILVLNTTTGLVIRGAEGSTPVAHTTGFTIQNVISAGWLAAVVPAPTAANQYPVSNSSDAWVLTPAGTVGGNSYSAGWTVGVTDLGGEALYSSSSAGTATIPSGLTSTVGATVAFRQLSTGALTIAGAGGVTVEGLLTTTGQYQTLLARQVSANVWAITGSQAASGGGIGSGVPSLMPALMPSGALTENYPRLLGMGIDTALTTGVPTVFAGPYVVAGVSYGHVGLSQSGTAPGTQTAAWIAILSMSGVVLAVTSNAGSTAWNASTFTNVSVALASAWVPSSSQQTMVALCVTAATVPSFRGLFAGSLSGEVSVPYLSGPSAGGTQSTPPTLGGTVSLTTSAVGWLPYIYLSA